MSVAQLLDSIRDAGWSGMASIVLFVAIVVTLGYNIIKVIGGLRSLAETENPINAHLIAPVYERYSNFPKALRSLALISMLVGMMGWGASAYAACNAGSSMTEGVNAPHLFGPLASGFLILALGAFNAVIAYSSYCVLSAVLALRYSKSIEKLANRKTS